MLDQLKQKNPALRWYSVHDAQFAKYGRIIEGLDTREIEAAAKSIAMPETGSRYVTSEPTFEALPIAKTIQNELFGGVDTELGYCWGSNSMLGATEWHTSSEINIAITDLVLLLATRFDIKNDALRSEDFVALLSDNLYRKYRKFMPQYDTWVWTITPWNCLPGNAHYERYVYTSGALNNYSATSAYGVAPACIFNPSIFK